MELHREVIENINGIEIIFTALEEYVPLSELLPEETEEELNYIWNNNAIFCAKLEANYKGIELSSDYLGGCIYEYYEDFYTKYKDDCFSDMYQTVIEEAKKELEQLKKDLNKLTIKK